MCDAFMNALVSLSAICHTAAPIPSQADEKLSDHDVKRLFCNAMPSEWIKALTQVQPTFATISLVDLVQFMSKQ
jgi:hypothetical protein